MSSFKDARVLITGGLGFIGSNLSRKLLTLDAKVTVVDSLIPEYGGNFFNIADIKDKISINISDVRDPYSMGYLIKNQDFLFNLAGQTSHLDSMHKPFDDLEINSRAQLSILEACKQHNPKVKIVFASTRQIYGKPQYLPVDEAHPLVPVDVNGVNKLAGEHFHLLYHRVYGIKSSVLRLTNTYGPRMRVKDARQTFLGIWMKKAVENSKFQIFGDGLQLRDFSYVDDTVDALLSAAKTEAAYGKIFNLGGEEKISLNSLAQEIHQINPQCQFELIPFPEDRKSIDIGDYYGSFAKAQEVLKWTPKVPLVKGLKMTFDFYKQHLPHYL